MHMRPATDRHAAAAGRFEGVTRAEERERIETWGRAQGWEESKCGAVSLATMCSYLQMPAQGHRGHASRRSQRLGHDLRRNACTDYWQAS